MKTARYCARRVLWLALAFVAISAPAGAEQVYMEHERYGTWEFALHYSHLGSQRIEGITEAELDADSASGWGTTVAYNFTNQWSLGLEVLGASPDYRPRLDGAGGDRPRDYQMDFSSTLFKGTWHLRPDELTPFISVGAGWTYIDSNIASRGPYRDCWWDAWWGYRCADYYSTEDDTRASLSAAVGLRWDFHTQFFTRISYGKLWAGLDGDSSAPAVARIEIGLRR